jgi:hypothetical protein
MTFATASRRTFQAVRRDSKPIGAEAELWRPIEPRSMRRALRAAERYDVNRKQKGARNGPLGHVGLEVYRALWHRVRFSDGCLCPSIEWIMKACARSRGAVVAALKRLKAAGFLRWIRRLEYTGGPAGVRGPQVRQITNAYALDVPPAAAAMLPAEIVPDDELARRADRQRELAEFDRTAFQSSPLGAAFASLGAALFGSASLPSSLNPPLDSYPKSGGRSAR